MVMNDIKNLSETVKQMLVEYFFLNEVKVLFFRKV